MVVSASLFLFLSLSHVSLFVCIRSCMRRQQRFILFVSPSSPVTVCCILEELFTGLQQSSQFRVTVHFALS